LKTRRRKIRTSPERREGFSPTEEKGALSGKERRRGNPGEGGKKELFRIAYRRSQIARQEGGETKPILKEGRKIGLNSQHRPIVRPKKANVHVRKRGKEEEKKSTYLLWGNCGGHGEEERK